MLVIATSVKRFINILNKLIKFWLFVVSLNVSYTLFGFQKQWFHLKFMECGFRFSFGFRWILTKKKCNKHIFEEMKWISVCVWWTTVKLSSFWYQRGKRIQALEYFLKNQIISVILFSREFLAHRGKSSSVLARIQYYHRYIKVAHKFHLKCSFNVIIT